MPSHSFRLRHFVLPLFAVAGLPFLSSAALADEGMWTFDNVPSARISERYGVRIDRPWLDRVQAAAVRISGCSGSVVSAQGLVMTNHHCIVRCAEDLSTPETNYVDTGFLPARREDEKTCPGQTGEILLDITDKTAEITAATKGLTGDASVKALNARSAALEAEACGGDSKFRCQIISLYQGGQYHLYRYRRYEDVRLVFVPEAQAAQFGGDPDNFNFPRYSLDVGFLRLYENGQPVATPAFLHLTTDVPDAGDPVFVAGNPGTTQRLLTAAQLETQRDLILPVQMLMRSEIRGRILQFMTENDENRRFGDGAIQGIENGFKVGYGQTLALQSPELFSQNRNEEARLKVFLTRPEFAGVGDPWAQIASAQEAYRSLYLPYYFIDSGPASSTLFSYARTLVRAAAEREKPSAERLPEYADSRLPLVQRRLMSTAPIYKPLDELYLSFRLSKAREYLTADAPETKILLGRESPEALADRLVNGTRLDDIAYRQALWDGGMAAIMASDDPMIRYALSIDQAARDLRHQWEDKVSAPTRIASEAIARLRFAAYGTSVYPDATFSLRLSYGQVKGWNWRGTQVEPNTVIGGLYDRATGQAPFDLPPRFVDAQSRLTLDTVYNFVTTNDIVGGNSGSPVLNARAEVVGAAFDGNIHSLGGSYSYDETLNRSVVVSSAAIVEILDKVYDRHDLLVELGVR